jgi:release factor glutamine methyltransferase
MKLKEVIFEIKNKLKVGKIDNHSLDAELLAFEVLGIEKHHYFANPEQHVSRENYQKILKLVEQRISGKPVSKILKKREFYGYEFYINDNVLDPRADSEILIEATLNLVKKHTPENKEIELIELGVGSGCLIITLLKELEKKAFKINAFGLDISENALEVTARNYKENKALSSLNLKKASIEDSLEKSFKKNNYTTQYSMQNKEKEIAENQQYNFEKNTKQLKRSVYRANQSSFNIKKLIISNPPYIKTSDIENLQKEVKNHDPILALDGGEDGLKLYRELATNCKNYLKEDGLIVLEIGHDQKQEIIEIFENNNYQIFESHKDLGGRDRCLVFRIRV